MRGSRMSRPAPRCDAGSRTIPKKWTEFQKRYFAELDSHPEACEPIRSAARHGRVTLVYSSHDTEHNNAVALKEYLSARKGKKRKVNHA